MAVEKSRPTGGSRYGHLGAAKPAAAKASWEEADQETLWRCIYEVTSAGDWISFSLTGDGGACVVAVKHDKELTKFYAHSAEEIAEKLAGIRGAVELDS